MNHLWLIHSSARADLESAISLSHDPETQASAPEASHEPEPLQVVAGVASVPIVGVLASERRWILDVFGIPQTSYGDIRRMVAEAESDPAVKSIEFQVDSPGGEASNALVFAGDAIFGTSKPTSAVVGNMAASAAYWLASQADEVVMSGPLSEVGSIGVVQSFGVGSDRVEITSTKAPNKRPDPTSARGVKEIRRSLDAFHEIFVGAVARGRGVGAATVNKDFGQGGLEITADAIKAGMADRAIGASAPVATRASLAVMDLETLKAEQPEAYAAAVALGQSRERSRVSAHLKLAKPSASWEAASAHILAGKSSLDEEVQADYLAASMVTRQQAARVDDDPAIAKSPDVKVTDAHDAEVRATYAELGVEI